MSRWRKLSRYLLPGWIRIERPDVEARIAIVNAKPDEPPDHAARRAHKVTAPADEHRLRLVRGRRAS